MFYLILSELIWAKCTQNIIPSIIVHKQQYCQGTIKTQQHSTQCSYPTYPNAYPKYKCAKPNIRLKRSFRERYEDTMNKGNCFRLLAQYYCCVTIHICYLEQNDLFLVHHHRDSISTIATLIIHTKNNTIK